MLTGVYRFNGNVACSGGQALKAGIYYFNKNSGSVEGRMEKGRTTIDYDGEKFTYYFTQNGSACANELNDGMVMLTKYILLKSLLMMVMMILLII